MKIKMDFVSNSSSTCFLFLMKGDTKTLIEEILKHRDLFKLCYETYDDRCTSINALDVIDAIEEVEETKDERSNYMGDGLEKLETTIQRYEEREQYYKNLCEETPGDRFYAEYLQEIQPELQYLKSLKEKGFDHTFRIHFGDNDGLFSGRDIGMIMDYVGRNIDFNTNKVRLITEQAR